jgi:hypothetical protein
MLLKVVLAVVHGYKIDLGYKMIHGKILNLLKNGKV